MPLTIAVTGADGFIGRNLCTELAGRGHRVRRLVRTAGTAEPDCRAVGDLAVAESLERQLEGAAAVVHLAARAHVLRETEPDPAAAFARANVDATLRLARASVAAGVRRFVFVSSIGVNGSRTAGRAFTEDDEPAPTGPYASSKLQAELALRREFPASLELVVVRPSLVYGPGVKGNLHRLLALIDSGLPLPLGSLDNRRNLIGVENLSDLIAACIERREAAGELFLAAEPRIHSTPGLLRAMAAAMHRSARLFDFPVGLLRGAASCLGARGQFDRLCDSLEVSSRKASERLAWIPRVSFEDGIARTAASFREGRHDGR